MALRPSMEDLITQIRTNINDFVVEDQVFADEDIQRVLDARRRDVYNAELVGVPSFAPGGTTQYLELFTTEGGGWESNLVIYNSNYDPITDSSTPVFIEDSDLINGRWTFNQPVTGSYYFSGRQYDMNGSSADMLELLLARVMREYDFLELGSTFKASQQPAMIKEAINGFRRKQWILTSQFIRADDGY